MRLRLVHDMTDRDFCSLIGATLGTLLTGTVIGVLIWRRWAK